MLIKCPECDLQISDAAINCPHCGYPLKDFSRKSPPRKKSNKRRRLPNGFGQIIEIKNRNLRNPFRVMITVSKNSEGRPICKLLKPQAYFASYNEAYEALVAYNKNPYDLEPDITVAQLYEKWSEEYFKTLKSDSSARTITAAWKYCSSIYNMRAKDLRARHIKGCMEEGVAIFNGVVHTPSSGVKSRIKSMFNIMLDYAIEYEIVDKNYSRTFNVSDDIISDIKNATNGHIAFSDSEMQTLWDNLDRMEYIDVLLIQCYCGWRPQELGLIEIENINLEDWTIIGGMKTEAGTDRLVPIHPRIRPLVKKRYDLALSLGSKYLFNCTDTHTHRSSYALTYDKYRARFGKIRDGLNLNPNHKAHDPRKQFVTMAKKHNVDEYAIKRIIGHAILDITEKVYTERDLEWLHEEIAKIV